MDRFSTKTETNAIPDDKRAAIKLKNKADTHNLNTRIKPNWNIFHSENIMGAK